jgi:hypothetical protein
MKIAGSCGSVLRDRECGVFDKSSILELVCRNRFSATSSFEIEMLSHFLVGWPLLTGYLTL